MSAPIPLLLLHPDDADLVLSALLVGWKPLAGDPPLAEDKRRVVAILLADLCAALRIPPATELPVSAQHPSGEHA